MTRRIPAVRDAVQPTQGTLERSARRGRKAGGMSDESVDIDVLDVSDLFASDVAALGDSVLGHAVRRALASDASGGKLEVGGVTIAAHDSHV